MAGSEKEVINWGNTRMQSSNSRKAGAKPIRCGNEHHSLRLECHALSS